MKEVQVNSNRFLPLTEFPSLRYFTPARFWVVFCRLQSAGGGAPEASTRSSALTSATDPEENERMRIYFLLAMAAAASLIGAKCGDTGIGDPCTPEDEYLTGFSGFSQSEVNVESRSFQCQTRVCLVNHFQGRVSCPFGQVEDPSAAGQGMATCMGTAENRNDPSCQPGGDNHRDSCHVPNRTGSAWEERIIPPVTPQLEKRQAVDTVYCSCRCAGPEGGEVDGAEFCECPTGFICEPLVEDLGLGKGNLAGSYCIKEDTAFDPIAIERDNCESTSPGGCDSAPVIKFESGPRAGTTVGSNMKNGCLPQGAVCGKDDTCCDVTPTECVDDENCFPPAACGAGGCVHPDGGGTEVTYAYDTTDCKEGDVCGG